MSAPVMVADLRARLAAEETDLALLKRIFAWARNNGWETGWSGPTWQTLDRLVGVDYDHHDHRVRVSRRATANHPWPVWDARYPWHKVASVRDAVDVLVAEGVLPVEFHTVYAAGLAVAA